MSNPSISEMVREHFAHTDPDQVARQWQELGCGAYASAGEFLDEMEVESFEIKLPLKVAIQKEHFQGFCAHIAKQAELFFAPAITAPAPTLLEPRAPQVTANNNTLALAA